MSVQDSNTTRRVILVHGMWMKGFTLRSIGNRLSKNGWQVLYYNYSSMFGEFEKNIDGLYRLWQAHNSDHTHLVGHSLGGLLILAMMEKYKLADLPRSVFIGSPVTGSAVAKKMKLSLIGRTFLGKSIETLITGRKNIHHNRIGIIAGDKGIGIGHLIQKLPKPHDGVVAADETKMEEAEDFIVLPVTHATMLFSKRVADAIDQYLSCGKFVKL